MRCLCLFGWRLNPEVNRIISLDWSLQSLLLGLCEKRLRRCVTWISGGEGGHAFVMENPAVTTCRQWRPPVRGKVFLQTSRDKLPFIYFSVTKLDILPELDVIARGLDAGEKGTDCHRRMNESQV